MLPKSNRLTKNGSFGYVYKNGARSHSKTLTLLFVENANESVRVGFSVNNKIGNAVVRNKVKRIMRAFVREKIGLLKGCQCVFVAKHGIDELDYDQLCAQMDKLFTKANLYKVDE